MHKHYYLIKENKTFGEAETLCKSRGESLVEIKNEPENEFIWKTIVKPSACGAWLGATNIVGQIDFK